MLGSQAPDCSQLFAHSLQRSPSAKDMLGVENFPLFFFFVVLPGLWDLFPEGIENLES